MHFTRKFYSDTIAKLQENSCNQVGNIIENYLNAYKVSWIYAVIIPEKDFLAGYYILIRRVKRINSVMVCIMAITYVLISLWIFTP